MPVIAATAFTFPEHYYPQEVLATAVKKFCIAMNLDFDLDTIDRFFTNVNVKGRYFTHSLDSFFDPPTPGVTAERSIDLALDNFEKTVRSLFCSTGIEPEEIALIASSTLTISVPSLEARLMNRIPFSRYIKRLPMFGYGCMGGAAGIARVTEYLEGHPKDAAIFFAGELSSALWQGSLQMELQTMISKLPDDPSLYSEIICSIVTAALFADGMGAVLMVGRDHPLAKPGQPRVIDIGSILLSHTTHLMGMDIADTGFRNILRPEVSDHLKGGLREVIDRLLNKHNLSTDDISCWIVHPGGPKVIKTIQEEFGLTQDAVQLSWDTLEKVGNMSSSTVLYMLNEVLSQEQPSPGSYGLMVAMGPGFSQEILLLQW